MAVIEAFLPDVASGPMDAITDAVHTPPAPAVPLAERLAARRAAVLGAPAWSPPPRAAPRPSQTSAEPNRLSAAAAGGSLPAPVKAGRIC